MTIAVRRADEADAEVLSLLNADVQHLHASAFPERFKPPGPDTFPALAARTLLANQSNLVFIAEINSEASTRLLQHSHHISPRVSEHLGIMIWNTAFRTIVDRRPASAAAVVPARTIDER